MTIEAWGAPIIICGQPDWLSDDERIDFQNADGKRWYSDGTDGLGLSARWIGWGNKPITIRVRASHPYYGNVQPAAAKPAISDELVERMVALVRDLAGKDGACFVGEVKDEARAIVAELPEPVDPHLAIAKRIKDTAYQADKGSMKLDWVTVAILEGISTGRQLEREGK